VPHVAFTSHLARHVVCPEETVSGTTVREALESYFARHPQVRSYVLDDQEALRRHVVIFVDGEQARDRKGLSDRLRDGAEVYVMQALSGG
jgi:molybdopterin converting factor small subunit